MAAVAVVAVVLAAVLLAAAHQWRSNREKVLAAADQAVERMEWYSVPQPVEPLAPEKMLEHLGTTPGSASVAGLLTDEDDYVQVIIDKEVAEAEWFGCNPGINTSHLKFKTKDLLQKYLPAIHHRARIVDL